MAIAIFPENKKALNILEYEWSINLILKKPSLKLETRDVGNYKIETFLILLLAKAGSMPCKLYQ